MDSKIRTSTALFMVIMFSIFVHIQGQSQYLLNLKTIGCTVNPEFADPPTCYFNNSANPPYGHFDLQMHREVKNLQYEITIDITVNKRKRKLLHVKKSTCEFFEGKVTAIIKLIKDVVAQYGELPKKCPVKKDFRYLFTNIVVDSRKLPLFFEGDFSIVSRNTEDGIYAFTIEFGGNIKKNYDIINFDLKKSLMSIKKNYN